MVETLKQFRSSGALSYVFGLQGQAGCLVLDPSVGSLEDYRFHFAESRTRPVGILLTSNSESALTATAQLRREQALAEAEVSDPSRLPAPGPLLKRIAGGKNFDSTFLSSRFLFSGHQILPGSAHEIPSSFRDVPDSIWILPSIERFGILFSNFATERKRVGTEPLEQVERIPSISALKLAHKVDESSSGTLFIDVREAGEFSEGHIPGSTSIPVSELPLHWDKLREARRIYVSCFTGQRSQLASQTLNYLGLQDVVHVAGGLQAWTQAGLPVQK